VIRQRLAEYESQTQPLIEFFREKGRRLFEIDASDRTPEALLFQICRTIQSPEAVSRTGLGPVV
jgi:adenylate kinase family enzyme